MTKQTGTSKRLHLSDLKQVARALKEQLAREAEQARLLEQQALRVKLEADAGRLLFQESIGAVKPLPKKVMKATLNSLPLKPVAKQRQIDHANVLHESLSDEMDVESLLETDSELSYRQSGIGDDVLKKLRRGTWTVQGEIDLHGLRSDEARTALSAFIRLASSAGWRCVRVVHGKGLGSAGKVPVLKSKVHKWLVQKVEVLAFVQARPAQGGAGALIALLA